MSEAKYKLIRDIRRIAHILYSNYIKNIKKTFSLIQIQFFMTKVIVS